MTRLAEFLSECSAVHKGCPGTRGLPRPTDVGSTADELVPWILRSDGAYHMELEPADEQSPIEFQAIGGLVTIAMEIVGRGPGTGCRWDAQIVMREEAAFRLWSNLNTIFKANPSGETQ